MSLENALEWDPMSFLYEFSGKQKPTEEPIKYVPKFKHKQIKSIYDDPEVEEEEEENTLDVPEDVKYTATAIDIREVSCVFMKR